MCLEIKRYKVLQIEGPREIGLKPYTKIGRVGLKYTQTIC